MKGCQTERTPASRDERLLSRATPHDGSSRCCTCLLPFRSGGRELLFQASTSRGKQHASSVMVSGESLSLFLSCDWTCIANQEVKIHRLNQREEEGETEKLLRICRQSERRDERVIGDKEHARSGIREQGRRGHPALQPDFDYFSLDDGSCCWQETDYRPDSQPFPSFFSVFA